MKRSIIFSLMLGLFLLLGGPSIQASDSSPGYNTPSYNIECPAITMDIQAPVAIVAIAVAVMPTYNLEPAIDYGLYTSCKSIYTIKSNSSNLTLYAIYNKQYSQDSYKINKSDYKLGGAVGFPRLFRLTI